MRTLIWMSIGAILALFADGVRRDSVYPDTPSSVTATPTWPPPVDVPLPESPPVAEQIVESAAGPTTATLEESLTRALTERIDRLESRLTELLGTVQAGSEPTQVAVPYDDAKLMENVGNIYRGVYELVMWKRECVQNAEKTPVAQPLVQPTAAVRMTLPTARYTCDPTTGYCVPAGGYYGGYN